MKRFDPLTYCKMITTLVFANSCITLHNYRFFFVVRALEIYSPSNFQVYNPALVTITTLPYIRSQNSLISQVEMCNL